MTLEGSVSLGEGAGPSNYDMAWNYNLGALQLGAGYEMADKANQVVLRAAYDMGPLTMGAYVQRDENGWGGTLGSRTSLRASMVYTVGVSEFHANYGRAGAYSAVKGSSANQFTLAYNHKLSKRSKVYGYYTKVDDTKGVYGGKFDAVAVGVRHNF